MRFHESFVFGKNNLQKKKSIFWWGLLVGIMNLKVNSKDKQIVKKDREKKAAKKI